MLDICALCNTVTTRRSLQIRNVRLGVFYRVLQLVVLTLVIIRIFGAQGWNQHTTPRGLDIELWTTAGSFAAMTDSSVAHCDNASTFWYSYSSSIQYQPTKCLFMSEAEAFHKQGAKIYIPTYVNDRYTTEVPVNSCSALACSPPATKTSSAVRCLCEETSQFNTQNPEQRILWLNHGFEVDQVDVLGQISKERQIGKSSIDAGADQNILTVFTTAGDIDTPCTLGGKSSWTQQDASAGINAPIEDWLRCAGVSLDDLAPSAQSFASGASDFAPKVRLTGAILDIQLNYKNYDKRGHDHAGPICFVVIKILQTWTSRTEIDFQQLPHSAVHTSVYRYRYVFGLSLSVSATGDFIWPDLAMMVLVVTSSLILLELPSIIMQIVTVYLLGRLSRIYSFVAIENFDIIDTFPGLCMRIFGYLCNHHRLSGMLKSEGQIVTSETSLQPINQIATQGLTAQILQAGLSEILRDEISNAILSEDEINRMVVVLMFLMDPSQSHHIRAGDFIHAATSHEPVRISDVGACFDEEHKASHLETLLGDIRNEIRHRSAGSQPKLAWTSQPITSVIPNSSDEKNHLS